LDKIIVADTGPLIAFAHLDIYSILPSILGTIIVPRVVLAECLFVPSRPDAVVIQSAVDNGQLKIDDGINVVDTELSPSLGNGEQAAIQWAKELKCPVLLDDKLPRRVAQSQGLLVIGTAGVLIKAKKGGKINTIAPFLEKLQREGYHLSPRLVTQILALAGET